MRVHAFLVMVNVPATEWHGLVTDEVQVIGRAETAQIRIPAQYRIASRRHAKVWGDRRGMYVADVGSTAGTRINGVILKANQQYELRLGDRLWLGGLELDICREPPEISPDGSSEESRVLWMEKAKGSNKQTITDPAVKTMLGLTHAELEVMVWMTRGFTDLKKLAQALFRSPNTVRTQMASIYRKLGVHSRDEVVGWLQQTGEFEKSQEKKKNKTSQ